MNLRSVWPFRRSRTAVSVCLAIGVSCFDAFPQRDPGVDPGDAPANLTSGELTAFLNGRTVFQEVDSVSGALDEGSGLGPRFNHDSCAGCHAFPAVGGASPAQNPQIAVATKAGAKNIVP